MHLVVPTHLSLFWVVCHPNGTSLPKEFECEPLNRLLLSPLYQTIPSLTSNPWPITSILAGYRLVVPGPCPCSTFMYIQSLSIAHAFAMIWRLICLFATHPWPLMAWTIFWSSILYGLLPSRAGPCLIAGFSLFSPLFAPSINLQPFMPCYSVIPAVVLFDSCLLGLFWACCVLFFHLITMTQHYH